MESLWQTTKIGIIIVHHQAQANLKDCLQSVCQNDIPFEHQILIVYDPSITISENELRPICPDLKFWENRANTIYASSCNQAAGKTRGEYLLFLNSNTTIAKNSIVEMVRFMDKHFEVGLLGSKIIDQNNRPKDICMKNFPDWTALYLENSIVKKFFKQTKPFKDFHRTYDDRSRTLIVDAISCSTACMIRRDAWKVIGYMDQTIESELCDIDYCKRAYTNKWQVGYLPTSVVQCQELSQPQNLDPSRSFNSEINFVQKYYSKKINFIYKNLRKLEYLITGKFFSLKGAQ